MTKVTKRIVELNEAGKRASFIKELILDEGLVGSIKEATEAVKEAGIGGNVSRGTVDLFLDFIAEEERTSEEFLEYVKANGTKTHEKIFSTYLDKFRETLNTVRNSK